MVEFPQRLKRPDDLLRGTDEVDPNTALPVRLQRKLRQNFPLNEQGPGSDGLAGQIEPVASRTPHADEQPIPKVVGIIGMEPEAGRPRLFNSDDLDSYKIYPPSYASHLDPTGSHDADEQPIPKVVGVESRSGREAMKRRIRDAMQRAAHLHH